MAHGTKPREYHLETLALHAGSAPDPTTGARAIPIYQTTAYLFQNTAHAAELFNLDEAGNIYTRIGNPTQDALEKRIALMEGGVAGVAFASGQAAMTAAITNLCRSGDEVVASSALYGGTLTLMASTLRDLGIETRFAVDLDAARLAVNHRTRALVVETIGNPKLSIPDFEQWAALARDHGIPLVCDNTFATPYLCRPLSLGADIVIHSLTKWIGGHGVAMGGIVVDGGRFDYDTDRYPQFSRPDSSYHGMVFAREWGSLAFATRLRMKLLRDTGAVISPFNAFLILVGLETLPVRMERACASAMELAHRLREHPDVAWVNYPGLADHPSHELARRYLERGLFGSMLNFGIRGGQQAGMRFIDSLGLWSHVANVGDAKSLVIHPASTTHRQLTEEEQRAAGADPDLIRLSVGLEHVEDLWEDLERGLAHAAERRWASDLINSESVIRDVCLSPLRPDGTPVTVAVVGLSGDPARPSYRTARKLQRVGYRIIPVNPRHPDPILGEPTFSRLDAVDVPVDVIVVFRASAAAPGVAREAERVDAPVFWMQEGVVSEEAAAIAHASGKSVVMNRCMFKEIQRLRGTMVTYPRATSGVRPAPTPSA